MNEELNTVNGRLTEKLNALPAAKALGRLPRLWLCFWVSARPSLQQASPPRL